MRKHWRERRGLAVHGFMGYFFILSYLRGINKDVCVCKTDRDENSDFSVKS